ncbi:MAG: hypothetical protein ACLPUT_14035 [Solirubrobacteraceae bacterium]
MKRLGYVGLCLVALFLLGATAVSAAQAAEYGRCIKAAKINKQYRGDFADKSCTQAVVETGKYEWSPGPGPRPGFTTTMKKITVTSPDLEFGLTCSGSGSGRITGRKTGQVTLTLTSCSSKATGGKCNSSGEPPGVINTVTLYTELAEPEAGVVLTVISPAPWYTFATEFDCNGVLARIRGSLGGVATKTDAMESKHTETFEGEPSVGGQLLLTEISINEGRTWRPGPESPDPDGAPTVATATISSKDEEKWEIKTL